MSVRQLIVTAVACLTAAGCSDPTGVRSDILEITRQSSSLRLRNLIGEPVYYFVVERGTSAVVDWSPCIDPEIEDPPCRRVAPRSSRTVPFTDIVGYEAGEAEVIVYHWRLIPRGAVTGWGTDSLRAMIVQLR